MASARDILRRKGRSYREIANQLRIWGAAARMTIGVDDPVELAAAIAVNRAIAAVCGRAEALEMALWSWQRLKRRR